VSLPNGIQLQNVRHTPTIKVNLIALADLLQYKPEFQWETKEFVLHVEDKVVRIPMKDRLWPIRLDRTDISKSLTNATSRTVKAIAKATSHSAQSLETWHKRLGHLNYADVKQLAADGQIKAGRY